MRRRILDTNILLNYWNHACRREPTKFSAIQARQWASELIALHQTDAILTPIYIEVIVGATTTHEAALLRAFLHQFRCVDEKRILPEDWNMAIEIANRIPRQTRRRKLGDCLIRAICRRLRYETVTNDRDFRL